MSPLVKGSLRGFNVGHVVHKGHQQRVLRSTSRRDHSTSFECAIHALAPACEYHGVKVIGHGVEANGSFYCCAHHASMAGQSRLADRA